MPGRRFNATTYVYSFNGKRDDKDADYGWQDYGMREYDRRRAQFISVDPLTKSYPWYSTYQFTGNKPLWKIDLDGMEEEDPVEGMEDREELLRREDQVENSKSLRFPTREERGRQARESEEFSRRTPEEQSARFRRLINSLNNYSKDALESAENIFGGSPKQAVFSFKNANRIIEAKKVGIQPAQALIKISTPRGMAEQSLTKEASDAINIVNQGATLYRFGTLSNSNAGEAQYWTTENPANYLNSPKQFANMFGVPPENLKSGQFFIESGKMIPGSIFITRPAPGSGSNKGGSIEVVTNPSSVRLTTFNVF